MLYVIFIVYGENTLSCSSQIKLQTLHLNAGKPNLSLHKSGISQDFKLPGKYATSRRGIKQLGISFGSIVPPFSYMKVARDLSFIVAGGNSNPLALNDVSPANAYKTTTYIVTKSVLKCNWLLLLKPLVTLSNSHFDIYVNDLIVLIVSPVTSDLHCGPVSPHTPFMENTNSTSTPTLQNGKSILQGFQKNITILT